jgi:hypothetical protein
MLPLSRQPKPSEQGRIEREFDALDPLLFFGGGHTEKYSYAQALRQGTTAKHLG